MYGFVTTQLNSHLVKGLQGHTKGAPHHTLWGLQQGYSDLVLSAEVAHKTLVTVKAKSSENGRNVTIQMQ